MCARERLKGWTKRLSHPPDDALVPRQKGGVGVVKEKGRREKMGKGWWRSLGGYNGEE